jgi:hypothetical protein
MQGAKHVCFEGADKLPNGYYGTVNPQPQFFLCSRNMKQCIFVSVFIPKCNRNYSKCNRLTRAISHLQSIPAPLAMDPLGDVIIAYEQVCIPHPLMLRGIEPSARFMSLFFSHAIAPTISNDTATHTHTHTHTHTCMHKYTDIVPGAEWHASDARSRVPMQSYHPWLDWRTHGQMAQRNRTLPCPHALLFKFFTTYFIFLHAFGGSKKLYVACPHHPLVVSYVTLV